MVADGEQEDGEESDENASSKNINNRTPNKQIGSSKSNIRYRKKSNLGLKSKSQKRRQDNSNPPRDGE
jgi:hypothetical protein